MDRLAGHGRLSLADVRAVLLVVTLGFANLLLHPSFGWAFVPSGGSSELQGLRLDERPDLSSASEALAAKVVDLEGFALPGNPKDKSELEQALVAHIRDHPELFGKIDPSRQLRLDYLQIVAGQAGLTDMAYAHFVQAVEDLDVEGGGITFSIKLMPETKVATLISRLFPDLPTFSQAAFGPDEAKRMVQERLQPLGPTASLTSQVTRIRFIGGKWRVVEEFIVVPRGLRAVTDRRTGETFVWDEMRYLDIQGDAKGRGVLFDPQAAGDRLDTLPLEDLEVTLANGTSGHTDANGNFTLPYSPTSPMGLSARLSGKWADVAYTYSTDLTSNLTVAPSTPVSLLFNPVGNVEAATAQVNAYYHITRVHQWLVQKGVDSVHYPVTVAVNDPDMHCNAGAGVGLMGFAPSAGPDPYDVCRNTAYDTIIYHEYGHIVQERIGKLSDGELSEGWGDVLAVYLTQQPFLGEGLYVNRKVGYARTADNDYPYRRGDEVHRIGQAWAGFAWHLRQNLIASLGQTAGVGLAESLVIPVLWADFEKIPLAVHQVAVRDDDDGNLANGTPHFAEIKAAADRHGLGWALQEDAIPPTVQILSPTQGSTLSGMVPISVEAQDNANLERLEVYLDRGLRLVSENPPWNRLVLNTCSIPAGSHTLKVQVYDWVGQMTSHQITVNVANTGGSAISDLSAKATSPGSVELSWTAPVQGNPLAYDVRYAAFPLTEANWNDERVTRVLMGVPAPQTNRRQAMTVNVQIQASRTYHFAMKTMNSCGVAASLSNGARVATPPLKRGSLTIASLAPRQAYLQVPYRYPIRTNRDGQSLIYSLPQAPLNFRITSGEMEWIPDLDQEGGTQAIRVLVTHALTGETAEQSFTITVSQGKPIPSAPRFKKLSHVPIDGTVHAVWSYGDYVYVTNGTRQLLEIFDISRPENPIPVATVATGMPADGLRVYQNRVYVPQMSADSGGLLVINVEDPRNPRMESFFMGTSDVHDVNLNQGFAYLATGGFPREVLIVDMRSPSIPTVASKIGSRSFVHEATAFGNRAYVADGEGGIFLIYDVADPRKPVLLGETPHAANFSHDAWPSKDGKVLFTTDEKAIPIAPQLKVWDISNPAVPELLSMVKGDAYGLDATLHRVHVRDPYAFVSYYTAGVVLWDTTDPRNLKLSDRYDTNALSDMGFQGVISVCPYGQVITAGDMQTGLWVLDLEEADSHPPTVSIESPRGGSYVRGVVPLSATASDESGIEWVQFQVDGVNLGPAITAAPYTWDWNTKVLSYFEGSHELTARAKDKVGHEAVSGPVTITVDNTPPTVPTGFTLRAVSSTQIDLTWVASTDPGAQPSGVKEYRLHRDGGLVPIGVVAYPGTSFSDRGLTPGTTYSYAIQAFDVVGNASALSPMVPVATPPLNRAPVLVLMGPKTVLEGELLEFAVSAKDLDGDRLIYSATGLPRGATFDSGTRRFSWRPSFDQSGAYDVVFTVRDPAGAGDSEVVRLTVADVNRAPIALAIEPERVGRGEAVVLDGEGSFDPDGEPLTYSWRQVGGFPLVVLESPGSVRAGFRVPSVGVAMTLTFELTVTDLAGAGGVDEVVVTVEPPPLVLGDTDGDGRVRLSDAIGVLRVAVGRDPLPAPTDPMLQRMDVNCDGRVTVSGDFIPILQTVVGRRTLPEGGCV